MSSPDAADGWDFTVPSDEAELLAELGRHGVRPGERVHVRVVHEQGPPPAVPDFCGSLVGFPEPTWENFERASEEARRGLTSYVPAEASSTVLEARTVRRSASP
jgi:hypothetical protein